MTGWVTGYLSLENIMRKQKKKFSEWQFSGRK